MTYFFLPSFGRGLDTDPGMCYYQLEAPKTLKQSYKFKTTPTSYLEKCLLDGIILCRVVGDSDLRFRLAFAVERLEPGQLTVDDLLERPRLARREIDELYNAAIRNLMEVENHGKCCDDAECPFNKQSTELTADDLERLKKIQW